VAQRRHRQGAGEGAVPGRQPQIGAGAQRLIQAAAAGERRFQQAKGRDPGGQSGEGRVGHHASLPRATRPGKTLASQAQSLAGHGRAD
jgi:hypothetical protein